MRQFSYPNSQFTNILGGASIGWKLNVYATGTSNLSSIYSDLGQTVPTANPVIADADGFLASFYWTGTIDVVLTDENDNIIDSANGIQDLVSTINAVVVAGNITLPFGTAAGDGNTITTTLPITADFSDGSVFIVRANANNAGTINTPNLQINSYASRRIKKIGGVALIANDIVSGMNMVLVYNESQDCYYLINHEATFLKRDGAAAMTGALDMDSHKITNLTAGTASADAVNYTQLTTYSGNSAVEFAVAAATTGNSAVNKTQFDAKTSIATDTVAGIVEKALAAELTAGTANKFPDALTILGGLTLSSGTNGYIKLPSWMGGFTIQWGVAFVSLSTTASVTYPIAFTTVHSVVMTMASASFTAQASNYIDTITTTSFNLTNKSPSSDANFNWIAIGIV